MFSSYLILTTTVKWLFLFTKPEAEPFALGLLANTNKAASEPVSKLIKSAAANAVNNFGMDEDSLYIAQIWANDGLRMKRYLPRAKGSASGLVKRNCHLYVVVKMR